MKLHFFYLLPAVLMLTTSCAGQKVNDSLLTGTWKGTSICQIKPSPCNDEIAVYHITSGTKPNVFHVVANKVIDGKEESMGEDNYSFNPADNTLFCYIEKYNVTVKFIVKGKSMEGTLTSNNKLYRVIKLTKTTE